ncbi:phosphate transport system substrate-binding protein [Halorubrum alkaliphilum]|uniref:Phosphate transport system substrate-binding protein n=1 Tax=Halorubrum alkaliphilum TaxID=261290 RepID=A0A8T4GFL3_9EURY|nr:PstS family phosphate ABC transporter substrate-binding protein [Halorubrum alkaliphilum]MBP1921972.1 phosphate transport system substrate-binding protein [Halorubrum alkaliphilum]
MESDTTGGVDGRLGRRAYLAAVGGSAVGLSGCLVRGADGRGLDGRIVVDGSNTLLPHGAAVAEEFQWRNNRVRIPVRGSGTGAGFQRFCSGNTDVQNASRAILDDEEAICGSNGIDFLELEAALDGIAVWAHPDNHWCDTLTVEELNRLWRSGSDVDTWGDLREEWADEPFGDEEIDLYGRDSASGTFDYFTQAINGEYGNIRSDYAGSADTNVIVRGVRGNRHALGFGGAGYYYENEDDLRLVAVDDGNGGVRPTRETIESGEYTPLSRPMYVYFDATQLTRPEFRAYAEFFFEPIDGDADESVVDPGETLTWTQWAARKVGYYAIPDETVEESRERLSDALARVGVDE